MKKYNRSTKVMILVVLVLAISIGFAALSTTLKINGDAIVHGGKWNIYWDNVEVVSGSVEADEPEIGQDDGDLPKTKVTWDVLLEEPGDFYEFTIDAVNAGTVDAVITDIESSATPTLPEYISYTVTYADGTGVVVNDPLAKRDDSTTPFTPTRKKYKVRVEFLSTVTEEQLDEIPEEGLEYQLEYDVTYGQASVNNLTPKIIPLKTDDGTSIDEVSDDELEEKLCGKYVTGFKTVYPIKWQYFYRDEDYVYLIADDYVPHKYLPAELWKSSTDPRHTGFISASWVTVPVDNIFPDARWSSGMASSAIQNNPIKDKYLKYANAYPTNNNKNAIATAYMMDTSVWANYAGNAKGAFAMGGPTLELLLESYNACHKWKYETYDTVTPDFNVNENGYLGKRADERINGSEWTTYTNPQFGHMFYPYYEFTPNVWDVSTRSGFPYGYWIASPSAYSPDYLPVLGMGGELYLDYNNNLLNGGNQGFRPVVAIPRDSIR